jgi:hypothetical protein
MEYANELERGELKLLKAKMLMSIGQRTKAECSLSEAKNLFREMNNADKLSNVLITKSQMSLFQSRVPLALSDIDEASISEGIAPPSKYGRCFSIADWPT